MPEPVERQPPLHLDWPGCRNARDVGGLPTSDGGRIRERALIRSDSHCYLTAEGEALLRAYGVSRAIDLRRPWECETWPSRLVADPMYQNVSVQDPDDGDHDGPTAEAYRAMLDRRPGRFAAVLAEVAEAPPGAVIVQCAAGKDRTGMVVALALGLAGVPTERIAWDYELTDERLRRHNDALLAGVVSEEERAAWRTIRHARSETMVQTMRYLEEAYGGAAGYLSEGGLTPEQAKALASRLVG